MKTKQIYYEEPYKKELETKVITVSEEGNMVNIVLDQTIFYPEGGGQPSDTGILQDENKSAKVEYVYIKDGEIIHQTKKPSPFKKNDTVKEILDWNSRYRYMRIHTAGHLLHDVLMTILPSLKAVKGSHGKKAFLEYEGEIEPQRKDEIEAKVNNVLGQDLVVNTKEASYHELLRDCQFVPPNLPQNKALRMIKIGEFPGMPDGGVHVKSTKEIGKIWIANITGQDGKLIVRYGIA